MWLKYIFLNGIKCSKDKSCAIQKRNICHEFVNDDDDDDETDIKWTDSFDRQRNNKKNKSYCMVYTVTFSTHMRSQME